MLKQGWRPLCVADACADSQDTKIVFRFDTSSTDPKEVLWKPKAGRQKLMESRSSITLGEKQPGGTLVSELMDLQCTLMQRVAHKMSKTQRKKQKYRT